MGKFNKKNSRGRVGAFRKRKVKKKHTPQVVRKYMRKIIMMRVQG
jgi:hypothetical protein